MIFARYFLKIFNFFFKNLISVYFSFLTITVYGFEVENKIFRANNLNLIFQIHQIKIKRPKIERL